MRSSSVFLHYTPTTTTSSRPTTTSSAASIISPSTSLPQPQRSPWHSPIPYLFGGLAAMLALIAFALLILACSYWKLSAEERREEEDGEFRGSDVEQGKSGEGMSKTYPVYEEKILVIMAGNDRPTCLATPRFSKADLMFEQMMIEGSHHHHQSSEKNEETQSQDCNCKIEDETRHSSSSSDQTRHQQRSSGSGESTNQ